MDRTWNQQHFKAALPTWILQQPCACQFASPQYCSRLPLLYLKFLQRILWSRTANAEGLLVPHQWVSWTELWSWNIQADTFVPRKESRLLSPLRVCGQLCKWRCQFYIPTHSLSSIKSRLTYESVLPLAVEWHKVWKAHTAVKGVTRSAQMGLEDISMPKMLRSTNRCHRYSTGQYH